MQRLLTLCVGLILAGSTAIPLAIASVTTNRTIDFLQVQRPQQQPVELLLVAELRQTRRDNTGREIISWNPLPANAQVMPQSILRYVVTAQNNTNRPVANLIVSQPVPEGMVYVLETATRPDTRGARVDFSIDGGRTFTERPVIRVRERDRVVERPAPAEMYTHVRWNFGSSLPANARVPVSYQARVR